MCVVSAMILVVVQMQCHDRLVEGSAAVVKEAKERERGIYQFEKGIDYIILITIFIYDD